jgi:hypothetical protein
VVGRTRSCLVLASCVAELACGGARREAADSFQRPSLALVEGIAVDASLDVFVTGWFKGDVLDFDGARMSGAGQDDVFVAKLDPSGKQLWRRRFGDADEQASTGVAVDARGNIVVVGTFGGEVDFGGGTLRSDGLRDAFVAELDSAGRHLWSRRFGGSGWDAAFSVAVDRAGNVLATGNFERTVSFGGPPLSSSPGGTSMFVIKLDPRGKHIWSKHFVPRGGTMTCWRVVADVANHVLLAGDFTGEVDFGGGPLRSAGSEDIFLVKLDPSGGHVWSKRFGDANNQGAVALAADGAGNVLLGGEFAGTLDLGGPVLTSAGGVDSFLAKLDPSGGHLWSRRFGAKSDEYGKSVAIDAAGNSAFTGDSFGASDLGGEPLESPNGGGGADLAMFDAAGEHLWSERVGVNIVNGIQLAIGSDGGIVGAGDFYGEVALGGARLRAPGTSVFVAKFGPDGRSVWARSLGPPAPH